MRVFKTSILCIAFLFAVQISAIASTEKDEAVDLFKKYINNMVQKVEKAEDPAKKREVLDNSFDNMISAFNTVSGMGLVSAKDRKAIATLKANIQDKKNELKGSDGYRRVPNNKLNNFANYVQQDLEQADTITISISVTLLVIILVLLLLL